MKLYDLIFERKVNPEQGAVSPGVQQLKTDQWMGTYKWSKDVAGHDGEKQHAPKNDSSGGVYKDAPVVVGYTDHDDKKTKAAMKGKVTQTVPAGSTEPDSVHKDSPLSKKKVAEAFQQDEANLMYRYDQTRGQLVQAMISNRQERQAKAQGYKDTPEQALKAQGIIRSKFDPKKFVQNQNGKWVEVFPYGQKKDVAEDSNSQGYYNEIVADKVFSQHPDLTKEDDVLNAAWAHVVGELGSKQARHLFNYDPDFVSDLVSSYFHLQKQGVTEAKNLHKKVKIVKGPDAGKTGWIREIKHGAFKGASKSYYIDIDGGGQANNLPATALRLVKDQGVAEGNSENRELWDRIKSKGVVPDIDRERYTDMSDQGLEGPFRMKNGQVLYYDPKEGKYYNRDTDMYVDYDDYRAMDEGKECPQCGSTSCTCEPGKCNCKPVEEAHPNSKIYNKCWTGYRKVPGKKRGEEGSCEKISEDDLDEAEVRHDRYVRSHGKKASGGHGAWMFTNKEYGEPGKDEVFSAPPGKFSDAVKHAKQWAKEKGHRTVYAMEDGLDEVSISTMRKFFAGDEKAHDPSKTSTMRDFFSDPANQNPIKPSTDKVFPSKQAYMRWLEQGKAKKEDLDEASVIYQLSKEAPMDDTEVLVLGGAGRYSLSGLRNKARKEAAQLAKDLEVEHGGVFRSAAHNVKQLQNTLNTIVAAYDELNQIRRLGGVKSKGIRGEDAAVVREGLDLMEKWTKKYKNSIDCSDPKGFSQKAHCAGKKK